MKAFNKLKLALISEPCLAFPKSDRKFTLIVDSAIGCATVAGGIGAILCQTDALGHLHPISYASRSLKNLKLEALNILATNHRPLVEKLNAVHSKND
jgi:hypothetical protein